MLQLKIKHRQTSNLSIDKIIEIIKANELELLRIHQLNRAKADNWQSEGQSATTSDN